jgi:hypothetical protein
LPARGRYDAFTAFWRQIVYKSATGMRYPGLSDLFDANRNVRDYGILLISLRRVAPFVAYAAIRMGATPFHINFFNFAFGLAICGLFALAPPDLRVPTASLLIVWQLLDATDGTMARALGIRSNYGGFIDHLGGIFPSGFSSREHWRGSLSFPRNLCTRNIGGAWPPGQLSSSLLGCRGCLLFGCSSFVSPDFKNHSGQIRD